MFCTLQKGLFALLFKVETLILTYLLTVIISRSPLLRVTVLYSVDFLFCNIKLHCKYPFSWVFFKPTSFHRFWFEMAFIQYVGPFGGGVGGGEQDAYFAMFVVFKSVNKRL